MKTSWHCDFVIITGASANTVNNSIVICSPIIGSYNVRIHTGRLPFSQVSLSGEPVACLACHLELLTFGYKCLHMKMFRCLEDNNHHVVRQPISLLIGHGELWQTIHTHLGEIQSHYFIVLSSQFKRGTTYWTTHIQHSVQRTFLGEIMQWKESSYHTQRDQSLVNSCMLWHNATDKLHTGELTALCLRQSSAQRLGKSRSCFGPFEYTMYSSAGQ